MWGKSKEGDYRTTINDARAVCRDCKAEFKGSVELSSADLLWLSIVARGPLPYACWEHHESKGAYGNGPQHNTFDVTHKGHPLFWYIVSGTTDSPYVHDLDNKVSEEVDEKRRQQAKARGLLY